MDKLSVEVASTDQGKKRYTTAGVEVGEYLKLAGDSAKIIQDATSETEPGYLRIWETQCTCGNPALCCFTADAMHIAVCSDVSEFVFVLLDHWCHWRVVHYTGRPCRSAFLANHV